MIISLKNKKIKTFVDSSNNQQDSYIDIGNSSVNFANNLTLFFIKDISVTVENFKVTIDGTFKIAYRDGLTNNFIETEQATDTELKISNTGGKQVRKWNIFLLSEIEDSYSGSMSVSYTLNGREYSHDFKITADVIGVDSKLVVLTQNTKFDITPDYYKAFKDSEHRASEPNQLLLNEKRKEFLLNYFDLTAQVGSYHTLLASLDYFGFGDLLSIRELWKNENGVSQTTTLTNTVRNFVENKLIGFKKTNQLQLVYKINEPDGTEDADGFKNYISVLFDTEEILIKMYALKRVLEKDFLPLNTKIVDIIGEHTSTLGVDVKYTLNDERIDSIDLNAQDGSYFNFDFDVKTIEINEHKSLLKRKHFIVDTNSDPILGDFPTGTTTSDNTNSTYFEIDKILDYDITSSEDYNDLFEQDDFLERYDRSDYGLLTISLDVNTEIYSRYKFEIYDTSISENSPEYVSELYNISELSDDKNILVGVRKLGTFKIKVYLFDFYGGVTWLNPDNNSFEVIRGSIDFKLARIDRNNEGFEKSLNIWSTFETKDTTNSYVEIDSFDSSLNINSFNEENNTNLAIRYQAKEFDKRTLQQNSFEFNNIPLVELTDTYLTDYGYEYGKFLVDVIGNGLPQELRVLKMRNFEHEEWDEISLNYAKGGVTYLTRLCSLINEKPDTSVWNKFTASVQKYTDDYTINSSKYVIRIIAKEVGVSVDNVYTDFTQIDQYEPIVNQSEDFNTIMPFSGFIRIHPTLGVSSSLVINGDVIENYEVVSVSSLVTYLKTYFENKQIRASVFEYDTYLIISTRQDLSITHNSSFGTQKDVVRGLESSKLKIVPSGETFYKGEPFYSYVDLNKRLDGSDYMWTLSNALNGNVLDTQNSYVYRNIIAEKGSYNLTLESTDMFGVNTKTKKGFVVVS